MRNRELTRLNTGLWIVYDELGGYICQCEGTKVLRVIVGCQTWLTADLKASILAGMAEPLADSKEQIDW